MTASLVVSCILIAMTKSPFGELFGALTDHFHHTRMTWTFLHVGFEIYTKPFEETAARAPFPHGGVTWEQFPMAYPPGMLLVFLPLALLGSYTPLSSAALGKVAVLYLTGIMHAALAVVGRIVRRVGSTFYSAVFVAIWIFALRASLLGFYEGAWLLCAAIGVRAYVDGRHDRSLLWFVAAGLLHYRSAAFVPFALVAFVRLVRGNASAARKVVVTITAAASGAVIVLCFYLLTAHPPKDEAYLRAVSSSLLPLGVRGYVVLATGIGASIALGLLSDWLVAAATALATILTVLHAGHVWHGFVWLSPFLALAVSQRRPLRAQVTLALLVAYQWQAAFGYTPLGWTEELLRFLAQGGDYRP